MREVASVPFEHRESGPLGVDSRLKVANLLRDSAQLARSGRPAWRC